MCKASIQISYRIVCVWYRATGDLSSAIVTTEVSSGLIVSSSSSGSALEPVGRMRDVLIEVPEDYLIAGFLAGSA